MLDELKRPVDSNDFASRGTASRNESFWLETIQHQGTSAFNPDKSYQVFRNVMDFGAKGDGITDDTAAINLAISSGNRCGQPTNCNLSTLTPALVYFPRGNYLISQPIIAYYYTQLVGDAINPPTLLASEAFNGIAVIDSDPYLPTGDQWYQNQNNLFFRSVRNFIIDVRRVAPERSQGTGIHWASGNAHQGIWMENGSGGFMSDLIFNGGKFGMWVGNQQFTVRNITVNNADTAVLDHWNWGWTFQDVKFNNCKVGFDLLLGVGAVGIVDAVVKDTPLFIRSGAAGSSALAGSLVLNNVHLYNVQTAVGATDGTSVLSGGEDVVIESWGQGNVYSGKNPAGHFVQRVIPPPNKPPVLLDHSGKIFGRTRPQYADYSSEQFVSVKDHGANGDGVTDDTTAIQQLLCKAAGRRIVFFDAGTYIVTSTITIPVGTRMVGEAWSVIAGKGEAFKDQTRPNVVVRVGEKYSYGVVEITDIIFTTIGPAAGAIVVEWNVHDPEGEQGATGMWDTHIRLGGANGSNLQAEHCLPASENTAACMAAFLALHLTHDSSAYLEGTWVWLADHDIDGTGKMLTLYSGRGILSESKGPVWMIGTASEHHVLHQYRLVQARNHYMGLIQTESPYWQPAPAAPSPFEHSDLYNDPRFPDNDSSAWALSIVSSKDIIIFGANLYSFYQNYSQRCLDTRNCQDQIVDVSSDSTVSLFSLSTVASTFQLSIDGKGVINQKDNLNGFASTVTAWGSEIYQFRADSS